MDDKPTVGRAYPIASGTRPDSSQATYVWAKLKTPDANSDILDVLTQLTDMITALHADVRAIRSLLERDQPPTPEP